MEAMVRVILGMVMSALVNQCMSSVHVEDGGEWGYVSIMHLIAYPDNDVLRVCKFQLVLDHPAQLTTVSNPGHPGEPHNHSDVPGECVNE